jgi:C-terminal peptidase prc
MVLIALGLCVNGCLLQNQPVSPTAGGNQTEEFEFCWWALSVFFIYQDKIPEDPLSYNSPAALYDATGDPYTEYVPPSQAPALQQSLTSRSGGIGIAVDRVESGYVILDVFQNSPGDRAGLREHDTIIAADGQSLAGVESTRLRDYLGGDAGDTKILQILRDGDTLSVTVELGNYYAPTVHVDTLDSALAYIQLGSFSDSTEIEGGSAQEFRNALLRTQWARHTILDLRGNPGGTLSQCVQISSEFVPAGAVIIKTKSREHLSGWRGTVVESVLVAREGGRALDRPFTVLTDERTASAAEALLSCLRDNRSDDVVIVGERTFGKGSGWYLFDTPEGGLAKLTGMLLTNKADESYNLVGVAPDIAVTDEQNALEVARHRIISDSAPAKRLAAAHRMRRIERVRGRYLPAVWAPRLVIDARLTSPAPGES